MINDDITDTQQIDNIIDEVQVKQKQWILDSHNLGIN